MYSHTVVYSAAALKWTSLIGETPTLTEYRRELTASSVAFRPVRENSDALLHEIFYFFLQGHGGQQRRVSFAVALMHDPELLILDEPTVGVDPLLRQSIWNHLVRITRPGDKTVIITTHYIEEARQAHCIGLMRSGRLLAEESPQALLAMYNCISLEDVFLKLSRKQGQANQVVELNVSGGALGLNKAFKREEAPYAAEDAQVVGLNFHQSKEVLITDHNGVVNGELSMFIPQIPGKSAGDMSAGCKDCGDIFNFTSRGKIKALIQKNFLRMWRNIGVMLFIFVLPVMQVILFCLAIGRDPSGLKLAIVVDDVHVVDGYCPFNETCNMKNLSCRYINHLRNTSIVKEYYPDVDSALDAVRVGDAWGTLYFNENYTDALSARLALGNIADNETIESSEVQVWLDMSNQQIGLMLNRDIQFSYRDFAQIAMNACNALSSSLEGPQVDVMQSTCGRTDLLNKCGYNPKIGDVPIDFMQPIYGNTNPSFTDFVAPGVILTIVFFLAVALTSSALIVERMEGLLDRSWVAGVSPGEILFSHVVTQFVVMCGQTGLVLIFMILVFEVQCNGNIFYVILLTLLQGLCGMCFGFVISAACELERNAIQLALGSFYPTLLLSGVIWPIEGMPWILRYVALCLPLTLATGSLRSILTRGWPISDPDVYMGFISTLIWIALFLVVTLTILKFKRG
ncbi:ABC transporter G family member 20 [Eumeta japonica]|uniref:ABC transporter G family member 20 n=1 Tax=Eumeta variegata TaxID=151549 RepID=A0A4C1YQ56_EUMVA|nr:ABC transporter G family member 20 [Eumeta japonica]